MNDDDVVTDTLPERGTPEYDRMRSEGKIVFCPKVFEAEEKDPATGEMVKTGEKRIQTSDGVLYSVGKGGNLTCLNKPPRMSKKARRKWRKEQFALYGEA